MVLQAPVDEPRDEREHRKHGKRDQKSLPELHTAYLRRSRRGSSVERAPVKALAGSFEPGERRLQVTQSDDGAARSKLGEEPASLLRGLARVRLESVGEIRIAELELVHDEIAEDDRGTVGVHDAVTRRMARHLPEGDARERRRLGSVEELEPSECVQRDTWSRTYGRSGLVSAKYS